jgi:hypothetical protein
MQLHTQEHIELLAMFERDNTFSSRNRRFDKEEKSLWKKGLIYQDAYTNELFLAYRCGYAFGKAVA